MAALRMKKNSAFLAYQLAASDLDSDASGDEKREEQKTKQKTKKKSRAKKKNRCDTRSSRLLRNVHVNRARHG